MKFKKFIREEEVSSADVGEQPTEVTIGNGEARPADDKPQENVIHMEVSLFNKVMEYVHNATEQKVHELTERATALSKERTLTMEDYEALVAELQSEPDDPNAAPPKEYQTMKTDPSFDSDKPTDPQKFGGGALSGM